VRILTVIGAVYNGLERLYPVEEQRTAGLSLQKPSYDSRKLGRRRVEGVLLASAGKVWGERVTEKLVWHVVKEFAVKIGVSKLAPHDLRRRCNFTTRLVAHSHLKANNPAVHVTVVARVFERILWYAFAKSVGIVG
jgi:site-specific recombinase XerD